jgi:hypothetical protein
MNEALMIGMGSALCNGTALTALLGGTAVFRERAPDGQSLPYVIYSWQGGGWQHDTPHQLGNGVMYVRGYSSVSAETAGALSDAIFALLDRKTITITGFTNLQLVAEAPHLAFPETDNSGVTTFSSGDEYRIVFDKN